MSEPRWEVGGWQTGPSTPSVTGPCCGGEDWPYETVTLNQDTIAIVPAQEKEPRAPIGRRDRIPDLEEMGKRARLIAAAREMYAALERAKKLVRLLTISRVLEERDDVIEAAGLNPWCVNEGLATGSERISTDFIEDALRKARGEA